MLTDDEIADLTRALPSSVLAWLACGERGISSNAIVQHLTGYPALRGWGGMPPSDPGDLRRCVALLERCPELVAPFRERMPSASPVWAALVERWDELTATLRAELDAGGRARRTAKLMEEIGC